MESTNFPAPLTPADCDLSDWRTMPLDVQRLVSSRFVRAVSAPAFRAGVLLWCEAWRQRPCASLPDDDLELAGLAGFGHDVAAWRALREEALRGFVRCSDGRLYHPVIAEQALSGYIERVVASLKGARGNAKRWGGAASDDVLKARYDDAVARLVTLNPQAKIKPWPAPAKATAPERKIARGSRGDENPSPNDAKTSPRDPSASHKDEKSSQEKRREENLDSSEGSLRSPSSESPSAAAAARARGFDQDAWFDRLVAVAGPGLADPAKQASLRLTAGELAAWARAGVDLELDAVPVVQARTAKARGDPIRSWALLRPDVFAAMARRTADLSALIPSPGHADGPAHPAHRPADRRARVDAAQRAALDAVGVADGKPAASDP